MASSIQSNPVYYSLASLSSAKSPSSRTVVLHKRPDHDGFGVYIGEDIPSGLYVVTVERNSPASDANIQPGDRVLAVNGQLISSMSESPKNMLMKAANNAESLTLTVQSTDLLQTLDIPLKNNYNDNNDRSKKRQPSRQELSINPDLENYIKSLFGNENVQILQTSNNNEYVFKSDPYPTSSMDFYPLSNTSYRTSSHRRERQHRRQHPPKRVLQDTKGTQTSFDDDQNENMLQGSPSRQYPTQPSTGTSHRILRTQQSNLSDNSSPELHHSKFPLSNKNSDFPSSPRSNSARSSTQNTHPPPQHLVNVVGAAMSASRKQKETSGREQISSRDPASVNKQTTTPPTSRKSSQDTHPPPQHLVNVVEAAMSASRKQKETSGREQVSSRDPASVNKQTTTPPTSRKSSQDTHPPPQHLVNVVEAAMSASRKQKETSGREQISSRDPASVNKQTTTPTTSRNPPENTSRDAAPTNKRTTTPTTSLNPPENASRDAASTNKRTTTPSTTRNPPQNTSRDAAPTNKQTITPPTARNPPQNTSRDPESVTNRTTIPPQDQRPPPPYTETAVAYRPEEPINNRDTAHAGSYNVRNAEESQVAAAATNPQGLREVHLHRSPEFQGYGFHLQYNRAYFLVQRIEADSPAEHAGLYANDVILLINGQKTDKMPHGIFVETVNSSSNIDFTVQPLEEYLSAHPPQARQPQTASTVTATINQEGDKRKTGISKAIGKLTNR